MESELPTIRNLLWVPSKGAAPWAGESSKRNLFLSINLIYKLNLNELYTNCPIFPDIHLD